MKRLRLTIQLAQFMKKENESFKFRKDIQVKVDNGHLSVNAVKSGSVMYLYVITNRTEQNNKQSPIEIEIFKWADAGLEKTTERQNLREFVMENNKCEEYKEGFYDL